MVGGLVALGPLYTVAGFASLVVGLVLLTSTSLGLTLALAILTLLPFGTLPFKAIVTPTLLSLALAGLFLVWVLRLLARSDTYDLRLTPLGLPILGFLGVTLFSLILGAGGVPDARTLHNYAKFVLGVVFFFTLVNSVRTRQQARLVFQALVLCGGAAALIGLFLYVLPDETALKLLLIPGRIGYPTSGRVLRYVEDDPEGLERAIGTSVDPNSFGGMLALVGAIAVAQLFSSRPALPRWLTAGCLALMGVTLLLTFSRAALFGMIGAVVYLATLRYRHLWWAMMSAGLLAVAGLVGLGMGESFVQRLLEGVQFQDQAQQMRLAEYQNALAIIGRYPLFGIGFGQAPEIDLVAGVSSIYLTIAERMGLLGLAAFLAIVGAWFVRSLQAMSTSDEEERGWFLGTQAGIVAALTVGLADHYFFNIEFSHMVALFWGGMGLGSAIEQIRVHPHTEG
ncbi:MAG: O-antigen ligase family protein [Chloroflexaceae bacterium]|nr:O-antigen ligase family protein [Chloroflexaceae bacterium]